MNKIFALLLFLGIGLISCKSFEKKSNKIEIAKEYYRVLVNSDFSRMNVWFGDSLITKEGEYEQTYTQAQYLEFLKWDSVFNPSYEIINLEEKDEYVIAKISKMDKRISILNGAPFITNQILNFRGDRVISVETYYVNFNEDTWERKKTELLSWIDENHPELNGFIYDQTEDGGKKFLRAIDLFENRN